MIFTSQASSQAGIIAPTVRSLLIALTLLAAATPAQAGPTSAAVADTEARNETIVREAFERWATGNGNVFDLLASDVRWTIHGSGPVAGTYNGVEDFVQRGSTPLVSRLASPLTPDIHHIWVSGDRVIIRFDASATTTSGAPYTNQFVWIFRMEDGWVAEAEAFLDLVAYEAVVDSNEPRKQ
ncbi:MAG: ketosteroid isomerase [Alphaproteobacteria bacterium HGW-Alphaproteobacteria-18]|nr:MAG: ketosteroid isomerase [Alphaproteobacteria bacterium HGW-Alphaproteobacteria-18]